MVSADLSVVIQFIDLVVISHSSKPVKQTHPNRRRLLLVLPDKGYMEGKQLDVFFKHMLENLEMEVKARVCHSPVP